ncbi:predicted protein [Chaetoceros tenuissimus]|uniref:Uncharacterized protein n=1 Tax=Chaetoceros tenuissimus TaxID=426638 RepID=A0AAD3D2Z5_9STRA|nr:predicted protein [Chaetoceros tenuissimus]
MFMFLLQRSVVLVEDVMYSTTGIIWSILIDCIGLAPMWCFQRSSQKVAPTSYNIPYKNKSSTSAPFG